MISNKNLNKFMKKVNKLYGEEHYENIDEFTISDLEFINDNMFLFDNDMDKVVECFVYTYF